jgi:hypothetical protein
MARNKDRPFASRTNGSSAMTIGPTGWNRDQILAFFVEVHSVFTPGVEICDQFELLAGPRMKWVSDSETSIQTARIRRS